MGIKALLFCLILDIDPTLAINIDSLIWTDANGKHTVTIGNLSSGKRWTESWKSSVEVMLYNIDKNGSRVKEWGIIEKAENSFSQSEYVPKTLQSIDLDGDKINEILFVVNISPEGSDPSLSKQILYSSFLKKVFKIEGIIPKNWGDIYKYKINIDPILNVWSTVSH